MVFSNLLLAGRNLARKLWRKAPSLCRHAVFGFNSFKHSFSDLVKKALKFLSRPEVTGVIAFAVALGVLLGLGFGTAGIAARSAAAAFQSVAYGELTPAGSVFAGLTSMAMTRLYPLFALGSAAVVGMVVAVVTFVVKAFGQGQAKTQ